MFAVSSDVIAFNRNTGMPRQKGAQTMARPITTSINVTQSGQMRQKRRVL
jgi:hypothetical protein